MEYRKAGGNWCGFGSRINPGRHYGIFGRLADVVRGDGPAIAPTRGFPADASYAATGDNMLFITESGAGEGECTLEQADRWDPGVDHKIHGRVPQPDWHSHSWVTSKEFEDALSIIKNVPQSEPEYVAMLCALKGLEGMGFETRVVFWFDN
jgi:hypothetical protein